MIVFHRRLSHWRGEKPHFSCAPSQYMQLFSQLIKPSPWLTTCQGRELESPTPPTKMLLCALDGFRHCAEISLMLLLEEHQPYPSAVLERLCHASMWSGPKTDHKFMKKSEQKHLYFKQLKVWKLKPLSFICPSDAWLKMHIQYLLTLCRYLTSEPVQSETWWWWPSSLAFSRLPLRPGGCDLFLMFFFFFKQQGTMTGSRPGANRTAGGFFFWQTGVIWIQKNRNQCALILEIYTVTHLASSGRDLLQKFLLKVCEQSY